MWLVWIIAFVILAVLGYYYFVSSSGEQDSDSDEDDDTFQDWLDSAIDEVADMQIPGAKNRRQNRRAANIAASHPEGKVYINPRGRARKCTKRRNRRGKCQTVS